MGRESQGVGDDAFLCLDAKWGVTASRSQQKSIRLAFQERLRQQFALQHRSLNMFQLYIFIFMRVAMAWKVSTHVKAMYSAWIEIARWFGVNWINITKRDDHSTFRQHFWNSGMSSATALPWAPVRPACSGSVPCSSWRRSRWRDWKATRWLPIAWGGDCDFEPPFFWVAGESENEKKKLVWEQGQPQV